jgi:hypothetical protein
VAATLLPPQGRAVVNVANLTSGGMDTLLADDLKAALSGRLELVEEVVVLEEPRPRYIRDDYCLVFGARAASSAAVHPPNCCAPSRGTPGRGDRFPGRSRDRARHLVVGVGVGARHQSIQ